MTTMQGDDVSKWQGHIDWTEAKQQIDFAMVKATQGVSEVDPQYGPNIGALRAAGERRGSYHYPDAGDPVVEADFYVANAGRQNGEMQALDFEGAVLTVTDPVGWAHRFLSRVIERTNNRPLIYMSGSTVVRFDWTRVIALNVGLWVASWDVAPVHQIGQWPFVIMWQRSDNGQLPGVAGNVDQDVFFGDAKVWAAYANNITAPAPAPAPAPLPPPPAPHPSPAPAPSSPAAGDGVHVVVQGDNLTALAQHNGVSVGQLVEWNRDRYPSLGWNPDLIQLGWRLIVHEGTPVPHKTHTVIEGDNLSAIAAAAGTTVAELVALNHGRYPSLIPEPDMIYPGWVLYLP